MNFAWNARLPRSIQESFTCRKSTTWDRRLYFPYEGRRAEDFFALENPTALVGFEPANLGTKGQHADSRPPKPLVLYSCFMFLQIWIDTLEIKYHIQNLISCAQRILSTESFPIPYGSQIISPGVFLLTILQKFSEFYRLLISSALLPSSPI